MNIEQLLQDRSFIDFCLAVDEKSVARWEAILQKQPELQPLIKEAKREVLMLTGVLPEELILNKQEEFIRTFEKREQRNLRLARIYNFVKIGAAASLLLLCGIFYKYYQSEKTPRTYSYATINGTAFRSDQQQRTSYTLPDGTKAVIYKGGHITLSEDYNQEDRRVAIKGQVYFDVVKNKDKPFVVYSQHITTTALGTSFFVRDFETGLNSSVLLLTGKVKVGKPDLSDSAVIDAGNAVLLNGTNKILRKTPIAVNELNEIAFGELIFYNSPSEEIFNKLEIFYGVEIDRSQCQQKLKSITGNYSTASLRTVLNALAFINKITWETAGTKIILKPITNPINQ